MCMASSDRFPFESQISPTMPVLGLFAMLNCFCHVIMYSYYALSSLGPRIQPFLWWKKYITQVQLFQFAIIGLYGVFLQVFHNGYPLIYRMMPVSQAIIFLFMFGQFYVRSYMKRKKVLWVLLVCFLRKLSCIISLYILLLFLLQFAFSLQSLFCFMSIKLCTQPNSYTHIFIYLLLGDVICLSLVAILWTLHLISFY